MEMIFHSHANKTHFHTEKGCAPGLILKVRAFGTPRKWPLVIVIPLNIRLLITLSGGCKSTFYRDRVPQTF